jgi:pyruvate dehydrogenase E2 component (dihydrolipoamide acetyltransferase)
MTTLRMPDLGTVEGTVTLVRWLKREGELVTLGEPLFEVETDKGVSEVESAAEGTLVARLAAEGAAVAAGDAIATIQGKMGQTPAPALQPVAPVLHAAAPAPTPATGLGGTAPTSTAPARGPTPSLIALARKHGVDLSSVKGTGPGGVVTRRDILEAKATGPVAAAAPGAGPGPGGGSGLGALQSVVAARVSQSHREKPPYHVTMRVDMTRTIAARGSGPGGPSFTAFFVKACAVALSEMPVFRRWISGSRVRSHDAVDIAVAIGVDDDLFAPAVRRPNHRSLDEISADIEKLADRARARSLGALDSAGTCFLVSNLGGYPVDCFDAVIAPEHAAALAVGAAAPTPVAVEGAVRIVPLAAMTLSVDHRLVNGGTAARFLARVKQLLEEGLE